MMSDFCNVWRHVAVTSVTCDACCLEHHHQMPLAYPFGISTYIGHGLTGYNFFVLGESKYHLFDKKFVKGFKQLKLIWCEHPFSKWHYTSRQLYDTFSLKCFSRLLNNSLIDYLRKLLNFYVHPLSSFLSSYNNCHMATWGHSFAAWRYITTNYRQLKSLYTLNISFHCPMNPRTCLLKWPYASHLIQCIQCSDNIMNTLGFDNAGTYDDWCL